MGFVERQGHMSKTAIFEKKTRVFDDVTKVQGSEVWTPILTTKVIFWKSAAGRMRTDDKFRPDYVGTIIFDTPLVQVKIPDNSRVKVEEEIFSVITAFDIAEQGKITQVVLKKYAD